MELYVHVPFCKRKCRYCDFSSWAGRENWMPAYVDAVLREAAQAHQALGTQEMTTAFLGGGTPSLLPAAQMTRLLHGLAEGFPLQKGAEYTSECNPGTLTEAWLAAAQEAGVNRLSMGMQAAQPKLLQTLGRIHTFAEVEASVKLARWAGIRNLNLDLMFGLPGQTLADWAETLEAALSLQPEHLSCYGLIPEEGTQIGDAVLSGALALPEEAEERAMYDLTLRRLAQAGFVQYEISNFAKPGYACQHNLGYWRQTPYLGLGPSAASMLSGRRAGEFCYRRTNVRDLAAYLHQAEKGLFTPAEEESVSMTDARFETMMLGLRTTRGVSAETFAQMYGISLDKAYGAKLRALAAQGLVEQADGWWRLTRRGMDVQNAVLVELMED